MFKTMTFTVCQGCAMHIAYDDTTGLSDDRRLAVLAGAEHLHTHAAEEMAVDGTAVSLAVDGEVEAEEVQCDACGAEEVGPAYAVNAVAVAVAA